MEEMEMYLILKKVYWKKALIPTFKNASRDESFSQPLFHEVDMSWSEPGDRQWAFHSDIGSLTVLDRMTGFGWRDIETGFRAKNGDFWLASGNFDVRTSGAKTIGEAIDWVKRNANNCRPTHCDMGG